MDSYLRKTSVPLADRKIILLYTFRLNTKEHPFRGHDCRNGKTTKRPGHDFRNGKKPDILVTISATNAREPNTSNAPTTHYIKTILYSDDVAK